MLNPKPRAATGPAEKRRAQRLSIDPAIEHYKGAKKRVDRFDFLLGYFEEYLSAVAEIKNFHTQLG